LTCARRDMTRQSQSFGVKDRRFSPWYMRNMCVGDFLGCGNTGRSKGPQSANLSNFPEPTGYDHCVKSMCAFFYVVLPVDVLPCRGTCKMHVPLFKAGDPFEGNMILLNLSESSDRSLGTFTIHRNQRSADGDDHLLGNLSVRVVLLPWLCTGSLRPAKFADSDEVRTEQLSRQVGEIIFEHRIKTSFLLLDSRFFEANG